MQLYYFTTAEHALSNISLRRLKISTLDKLNDPFEWLGPACEQAGDRAALRSMKKQMGEKSGLICFSEAWTNPVHWSHYAEHHRGMCLGFDVGPKFVTKVVYEEERTVINDLTSLFKARVPDHDWLVREVICRKFKHWEYEQEWRAFVTLKPEERDNGNHFMDFNDDLKLNKVIVGPNCDVRKSTVERAVGALQDVVLMKARLAFNTFSVCEQLDPKNFR